MKDAFIDPKTCAFIPVLPGYSSVQPQPNSDLAKNVSPSFHTTCPHLLSNKAVKTNSHFNEVTGAGVTSTTLKSYNTVRTSGLASLPVISKQLNIEL